MRNITICNEIVELRGRIWHIAIEWGETGHSATNHHFQLCRHKHTLQGKTMSTPDRIYYTLADSTIQQSQWEELVGKPSTSLVPTRAEDSAVLDEYTNGIVLDEPVSSFQHRLAAFGDVPVSTFSILA